MQLSILQSRLAASLIASCLLILLYLTLFSPHFAVSLEIWELSPLALDAVDASPGAAARSPLDVAYEPEFAAFDRSIIGRAPAGVTALTNNEAMPMNIPPGSTQFFMFTVLEARGDTVSSLELRSEHDVTDPQVAIDTTATTSTSNTGLEMRLATRQTSRTVYISANTCEQPEVVDPSKTAQGPPQLTLFVSTSASNESPGPLGNAEEQVAVAFVEGAVMYNMTTSGDIFIGVSAPNVTSEFKGTYNLRIAASTDAYFYSYNVAEDADLIWVDSDAQGALLITHNLTQAPDPQQEQKLMSTQPYVMFAHNKKDHSINGLMHSYCGLQNHAQIAATKNGQFSGMVSTGMTKRGPGNLPKQQFFFTGLNSSAEYLGILAKNGNSSISGNGRVAGGGHVSKATQFSTKSGELLPLVVSSHAQILLTNGADHGNCGIIVDLAFCDQVAYSVPSNPNFGNATQLAKFYDDYAAEMYKNFNRSLAQIACEAPSSQRYSLARNCSDCATAYKAWLCSVTIPRCEDFDNPAPYLHPRAMAQPFPNGDALDDAARAQLPLANSLAYNSSRNSRIDKTIQPGPYKELLPCEDLCYDVVRSCPASMGFSCPQPGQIGFSSSYGRRAAAGLTCNYPGSAHQISGSERAAEPPSWTRMGLGAAMAAAGLLLL